MFKDHFILYQLIHSFIHYGNLNKYGINQMPVPTLITSSSNIAVSKEIVEEFTNLNEDLVKDCR